jgi:hypothetical protein
MKSKLKKNLNTSPGSHRPVFFDACLLINNKGYFVFPGEKKSSCQ